MASVLLHTQNINISTLCLVAKKSITYRNLKIYRYRSKVTSATTNEAEKVKLLMFILQNKLSVS